MSADPFDTPAAPWFTEPDPFDTPPFDPITGELLETEPAEAPPADLVPVALAVDAARAVEAVDHATLTAFTGDLRAALEARVGATYSALLAARPTGPVTADAVAPELAWLADAADVFDGIGKVLTAQAKGVRELAGDVVQEVHAGRRLESEGGSASVKVGSRNRPGSAVKVTATQPTETYTDTTGIVDVLVPYLLERPVGEGVAHSISYAAGARAMARVLLGLDGHPGLLAAPKWKSSALEVLRGELQSLGAAGAPLAGRLAAAFGRRPHGSLRVQVERVDPKEVRDL